jgi:Zn-dependent alcohol dehydrogenase
VIECDLRDRDQVEAMVGQLRLEELVSQRYELDAINKGYADLHAGRNIRGLVVFGEG